MARPARRLLSAESSRQLVFDMGRRAAEAPGLTKVLDTGEPLTMVELDIAALRTAHGS
jgi:hypothetical protein